MANKRMFDLKIVDTDLFLEMPLSTQCLYFHLNMRADDDGFISNPKKIMKVIGASEDDFKILMAKSYIIPFETGVCVIRHWKINNYLRTDRYKETMYTNEKKQLNEDENGIYELGIPVVYPINTNLIYTNLNNIEEDINIIYNNNNNLEKRFLKPTIDEIKSYCIERKNNVDADKFFDYYESNGWYVGKKKMKDWKASVRTWEKNEFGNQKRIIKPSWNEEDLVGEEPDEETVRRYEEILSKFK